MTLIVAADTQDYLILAGDHCAVMSPVSNHGRHDIVIDNYRKVYPWKYGAIAGSGDVFLMVYFVRLFLQHERRGRPIDLLQVAREAKAIRSRAGVPSSQSTGNIFFTLPAGKEFRLHAVLIEEATISCDAVDPVSSMFSMNEDTRHETFYANFNACLRPSFLFESANEFHLYHLNSLRTLFLGQSKADDLVTATFDVIMIEKRSGAGAFWQVSPPMKQIAFVHLDETGFGDAARSINRSDQVP